MEKREETEVEALAFEVPKISTKKKISKASKI
jgi:hypothetical protein